METSNNYTINSCGIHDCDSKWIWRTKGSKDYNLWAVFRGEGTLSLCDVTNSAVIGSCFLIPPQTLTYGTHNPNNRLLVYSVHFNSEKPLAISNKRLPNVPFFKELFERTVYFYNMNRKDVAEAYLYVLLNEFFSSPDVPNGKQKPEKAVHQKCISEICERINSSPDAKHKLSALATEYGYSATYLGRLFHKMIGVGFSDYLLSARINYAKILLLNSKLSIMEISEKLGYYDTAHFINQFKNKVGCTPSAFR